MHDIRVIRHEPDLFDKELQRRGIAPLSKEILSLDEKHRAVLTDLQALQQARNEKSRLIGQAKGSGDEAQARSLMDEVAQIKEKMASLEAQSRDIATAIETRLSAIPNLPAAETPEGKDESENIEIRRHGVPCGINNAQDHVSLGEGRGIDFERAARLSGARFVWLEGQMARLERALANFMLDLHVNEFGYTEISPPCLVHPEAMYAAGQLPKFAEDAFKTQTDHYLIPTAEVPLTASVMDQILAEEELPLRYTAYTPCFRREAGAAGKDTRGMIRQHQFHKVELVSITTPEQSSAEHERMAEAAETVLKRLELPFRTIVLCTGDMGFAARKTYDLEVWLPGQNAYREISSCSNCGDFQARRMKARCRKAGEKETRFVHTLNGSGVAVGRALIAVIENYQQADGRIAIPDVLKPYMGGTESIEGLAA